MKKTPIFILCIFFFVLGLFFNPFDLYEGKKNKDKINEVLADTSISMNLFGSSLDNNYDVVKLNNNTFKIKMYDERTFIIFFEKGEYLLEVFEYKNSMRWFP